MVNLTIDPNSHAITALADQVKKQREQSAGKDDLKKCVSHVIGNVMKKDDAKLQDFEKKMFKPGQDVPIDFYINLNLADSRVISILSQTLIEKISSEPKA